MNIELVATDLEGVLTTGELIWVRIHNRFGTLEKAEELVERFRAGEITYHEWIGSVVSLWKGRSIKDIEEEVEKTQYTPGARELIEYLKSRGLEIIIISSGLYRLARKVAAELGINTFYANRILDSDGIITGDVVVDSPYHSKGEILKSEAARSGISTTKCLAIGDDRNDVSLFEEAGVSVAFGKAHPELIEVADHVVDSGNLLDLIELVEKHI